jgi:hypothetical protein
MLSPRYEILSKRFEAVSPRCEGGFSPEAKQLCHTLHFYPRISYCNANDVLHYAVELLFGASYVYKKPNRHFSNDVFCNSAMKVL